MHRLVHDMMGIEQCTNNAGHKEGYMGCKWKEKLRKSTWRAPPRLLIQLSSDKCSCSTYALSGQQRSVGVCAKQRVLNEAVHAHLNSCDRDD